MSTSSTPGTVDCSLSPTTTTPPGAVWPPVEVAPPQAMLVTSVIEALRGYGYDVRRGSCGDLHTAAVAIADGRHLVLLPMAETIWGDSEAPDVGVWHLMALDDQGRYLEYPYDEPWPWHCPSVLWAHSLGLDPAAAVFMVEVALADDHLSARFGLCA